MDLYEIRNLLRSGTSINDIPLRVTYYTRVSTDSEEQMNSLKNQTQYYDNLIRSNTKWTYVDGYIDEGLTGVTTKRRERFNDMVDDAADSLFDLIITKEVSRFARNTVDSLGYTRSLLNNGVGVFFHEQNINTLSEEGELRLTIMSALAQEESQRLSSRVKFGHAQSIKNNVVHGNSLIYGYKKDNKRLVIDEEQAPMVAELYELYATDQYSLKKLSDLMYEKGYRNSKGNQIAHNTLGAIITNPKYKGYYCGNKVKVVDLFTKKQKFLPESEWRMFKDETGEYVPAIVDEAIWEKANVIFKRRSADVIGRKNTSNRPNIFTGKIHCQHCDATFYKKASSTKEEHTGKRVGVWVCSEKIRKGRDSCPARHLYEDKLCKKIADLLTGDMAEIESRISKYEGIFRSVGFEQDNQKKLSDVKSNINAVSKKLSKALELNISGKISDNAFSRLSSECDAEMLALQEQYAVLEQEQKTHQNFEEEIRALRSNLRQANRDATDGLIDRAFVNKYVETIRVTTEGKHTYLDISLGIIGAMVRVEYT